MKYPNITECIYRRMLSGGALLGAYGMWVAWAWLPHGQSLGNRTLSSLWAIAIFATVGAIFAALVTAGIFVLTSPMPTRKRASIAAIIESLFWVPLLTWLLFNEVVYATTSEVLGAQTFALLWANPAATLEAAWEMGGRYLMLVAGFFLVAAVLSYYFSRRSFRNVWPMVPVEFAATPKFEPSVRVTGSMTGGILVLACLLTWQLRTQPSEALTTVFRSAPPLRALDLTRSLIGTELNGPTHGPSNRQPIISDF